MCGRAHGPAALRWLIVTLFNTAIASTVISQFQATIVQIVALAVLMPIVAAMGGNAGMQVITVTVRALATSDLNHGRNMFGAVRKSYRRPDKRRGAGRHHQHHHRAAVPQPVAGPGARRRR